MLNVPWWHHNCQRDFLNVFQSSKTLSKFGSRYLRWSFKSETPNLNTSKSSVESKIHRWYLNRWILWNLPTDLWWCWWKLFFSRPRTLEIACQINGKIDPVREALNEIRSLLWSCWSSSCLFVVFRNRVLFGLRKSIWWLKRKMQETWG